MCWAVDVHTLTPTLTCGGGRLRYLVQLVADGRSVTRMLFTRTGTSSLPSCVRPTPNSHARTGALQRTSAPPYLCPVPHPPTHHHYGRPSGRNRRTDAQENAQLEPIAPDLFFLGSRLGDSLLVQVEGPGTGVRPAPLAALAPAPAAAADAAAAAAAGADDLDALDQLLLGSANAELHGSAGAAASAVAAAAAVGGAPLTYTVCDSLLNIGPVGSLTLGEPASTKVCLM
jgi:hypothetical protein